MKRLLTTVAGFFLKLARPDPAVPEGPYRERVSEPVTLLGGPGDGREFMASLRPGDTLFVPVIAPMSVQEYSDGWARMEAPVYEQATYTIEQRVAGLVGVYQETA